MSKVKHENYVVVQGWMINKLNLKGNALLVYAIIYGFSQSENQKFSGSIQYLVDWTNSSRRTVINCLNELVENKLLEKHDVILNGVKFCEYKAILDSEEEISLEVQKLHRGSEKIAPNNIDNNLDIKYIVEYLNSKANTNYKYTTKNTADCIKARLNEGFTVEDFKSVIDKKCGEWMGTDMEKFIRPQTLFGTKFESYLNQKVVTKEQKGNTVYDQYQYL